MEPVFILTAIIAMEGTQPKVETFVLGNEEACMREQIGILESYDRDHVAARCTPAQLLEDGPLTLNDLMFGMMQGALDEIR